VLSGDEGLVQRAFYGKYGVLDQLRRGVTADGMWYEGSVHYHFYSLQPLCNLLLVCQWRGFEVPELPQIRSTVEKMCEYPLRILFRGGQFPNPNDAHPVLRLDNYASQYECASALFDNDLIRQACGALYGDGSEDGGVWRLLFNRRPRRESIEAFGSVNNADAYTAMLRSRDTEVFIKYGTLTRLHVHPDIMNIELAFDGEVVAADLGTGGYGSFLFAQWQRLTTSHNTVAVDMNSQKSLADGIVDEFDAEVGLLRVTAKGVYDAVNYSRELRVGDSEVGDRFRIDGYEEHTLDWFFYCLGDLQCAYETEPVESLGDANGYQHLLDIRRFTTEADLYVDFVLESKTVRVAMAGSPGTAVHLVSSYMDSTEHRRQGLVVRRQATTTLFDTRYTCTRSTGRRATPVDKVRGVGQVPPNQGGRA